MPFASHTAVEEGDARFAYGGLSAQANSIAGALLERRGEKPEAVGVFLSAGRNAIAAMLGVCKAGKYFVPLDPSYTAARNRFVLEDSGLVSASSKARLPGPKAWPLSICPCRYRRVLAD
jgi:acyl-CoA synthetase (AMP-forming)/AMP-acid ligase II